MMISVIIPSAIMASTTSSALQLLTNDPNYEIKSNNRKYYLYYSKKKYHFLSVVKNEDGVILFIRVSLNEGGVYIEIFLRFFNAFD